MTTSTSARRASMMRCHACGRLYPLVARAHDSEVRCGLCDARLHLRKPNSITRTWALVCAAFLLYIPANVYPVMTVRISGRGDPSTILGGVEELFDGGQWPVAVLLLFASIMVPMLKLCGLTFLLLSVHFKSRWRPRDRTRLFRVIEAVGRWSMIDIFELALLVALVKLGAVATIEPGIGATSFACVVVITMFAAATFDSRLLWDCLETNHDDR